ncbi:CxxxxCH/CxxCH domain-containing protein [Nonomuraea antimicrobica]
MPTARRRTHCRQPKRPRSCTKRRVRRTPNDSRTSSSSSCHSPGTSVRKPPRPDWGTLAASECRSAATTRPRSMR